MVHDDDSNTSYSGGGSSTTAGSGVTGDDGDDTTYSGGGSSTTTGSGVTGDSGSSSSSGDSTSTDSSTGSSDDSTSSSSSGGVASDTSSRSTTFSGGGSSTTAGSGATGGGTETTFSGGGGDETTTQTGSGITGDEDSSETDSDTAETPEGADADRLSDADRGFSVTRVGTPLSGGQLEQSERARDASRDRRSDEREELSGLEEEVGALSGEESELADQVQQLQGRINRETPVDAFLDTEDYAIRREGDRLTVEFADRVGQSDRDQPSPTEQRQRVAGEIASNREGVEAEDVTVTQTADGFQATTGGGSGAETVITGAPEPDRDQSTTVRGGETEDRGVGITSGPGGGEVVLPALGETAGETRAAVTRRGQQQLDAVTTNAGDVRAAVTRFGQVQLDSATGTESSEGELIEVENPSTVELLTGQAGGRRFEQAVINEGLESVGLEEELGFREPTARESGPDPSGDSAFEFLRGAGPRRRQQVEGAAGERITQEVTSEETLGAAAAGVAAPEPATTLGGAAILATAGVAVASEELEVPEDDSQGELEAPEQPGRRVGEIEVPEQQQTVSPSELGIPDEAFEEQDGELPVSINDDQATITDDGEVELPAQASGVVIYRERDEEEEEEEEADEEEEEEEEEEQVEIEVPEEFIPDEEVTIGGEEADSDEVAEPEIEPPVQGQEDAEPDETEGDEEFDDQPPTLPEQGQQSDAIDPERTFIDGEFPRVDGAEDTPQPAIEERTAPQLTALLPTAAAGAGATPLPALVPGASDRGTVAAETQPALTAAAPQQDQAAATAPAQDVFSGLQPAQAAAEAQAVAETQTAAQAQAQAQTPALAQLTTSALAQPQIEATQPQPVEVQEPELAEPTTPAQGPPETPLRRPRTPDPDGDADEDALLPGFGGARAEELTDFRDPLTGGVLETESSAPDASGDGAFGWL